LRDVLSRRWGRRHKAFSPTEIVSRSKDFYRAAGGGQKKLGSRGGFQAAFPLYHMNRHKKQTSRQKPKLKPNLEIK